MTITDYLSHCELCLLNKAIDKRDNFKRDGEAWVYAIRMLSKCDASASRVASRMSQHPDKAGFVFDQYFFAEFKRKPFGGEETKILPHIQTVAMLRHDSISQY